MPAHIPPMHRRRIIRASSGLSRFKTDNAKIRSSSNSQTTSTTLRYLPYSTSHFQHGQLRLLSTVGCPSYLYCMASCRHLLLPMVASSGSFQADCLCWRYLFPPSHISFLLEQPFEACLSFIKGITGFLEKLVTWPRDVGHAIASGSSSFPAPL